MDRRKFIASVGTVGTVAIAGCSGEETTTSSSGDTESSDDSEGLVIEEHELVDEDFITQIEGVLRNDTGEEQSYIEVKSTVYDEDDVRINSFFTNTTDVPNGERWRFEIPVTEDAEDVERYELEASTSAF